MAKLLLTLRNLFFIIAILLFLGAAIILVVKAFEYKALVLGLCAVAVVLFGMPTVKRLIDWMTE